MKLLLFVQLLVAVVLAQETIAYYTEGSQTEPKWTRRTLDDDSDGASKAAATSAASKDSDDDSEKEEESEDEKEARLAKQTLADNERTKESFKNRFDSTADYSQFDIDAFMAARGKTGLSDDQVQAELLKLKKNAPVSCQYLSHKF